MFAQFQGMRAERQIAPQTQGGPQQSRLVVATLRVAAHPE